VLPGNNGSRVGGADSDAQVRLLRP